jgi:RNA polymerase sigma-70 factor (ECF subfamily)
MPVTDTSSSNSASLIQRVREFDADAWQRLCNIYGPLVYRWVRQSGLHDTDAEDVGQEVFRTVSARIGTFRADRETDTFRGWLWTITRNKIGDSLRRRASQPQTSGGNVANQLLRNGAALPNDEPSDAYGFDSQKGAASRFGNDPQ